MNFGYSGQLIDLVLSLLISWLVWGYYHRRTCPPGERYSTFGPRFWTAAVDSLVLWPITFLTQALLLCVIPRSMAAALLAVQSLTWLIYTVAMHAVYGQTVGKMVTKVRVVDYRTEGAISWCQAWLREGIPTLLSLGCLSYEIYLILTGQAMARAVANGSLSTSEPYKLLAAVPGFWFAAEVVTMLTNTRRRALHDFIAGTVVVRTNAEAGQPCEISIRTVAWRAVGVTTFCAAFLGALLGAPEVITQLIAAAEAFVASGLVVLVLLRTPWFRKSTHARQCMALGIAAGGSGALVCLVPWALRLMKV